MNFGVKLEFQLKHMKKYKKYKKHKKYMKIKLNSDDQLPLNKAIEIPIMTIVVRAIFLDNIKFYYTPYEREIWHYEKANAQKNVNQKVYLFNQTIK